MLRTKGVKPGHLDYAWAKPLPFPPGRLLPARIGVVGLWGERPLLLLFDPDLCGLAGKWLQERRNIELVTPLTAGLA